MEQMTEEKEVSQHKESLSEEYLDSRVNRGHVGNDEIPVEFDRKAEAKLRLKIDLCIVPTVALLYLFCFIDRANVGAYSASIAKCRLIKLAGNAKLAGFEEDLGLQGNDYNAVLSVFYISYILFEIPSNIACKWLGPGWFLPGITLLFGVCSLACAFVTDFNSVCGVRFLLGVFEGMS